MSDVTRLLESIDRGDPQAASKLLPLVYDELRRLARQKMARERPGMTLGATALVHEAYLRLVGDGDGVAFDNRGHFFVAAAEAMRRILIDTARRKLRERHGGKLKRVELADDNLAGTADARPPDELLALDEALTKLASDDAPATEVAKLRLYAGLSVEEAAAALGISRATAYRQWTYARAALRCSLGDDGGGNAKALD